MAPSARRATNNELLHQQQHPQQYHSLPPQQQQQHYQPISTDADGSNDIFVDPAMGTPLSIYVERDVANFEPIVALVKRHGGIVSSNYSTVPYLLVDRQKETGQSLYRQYHNKKGKVVLDAQWVVACVQAGEMLTFKRNWGGFKVTGNEAVVPTPEPPAEHVQPEVQIASPPDPNNVSTANAGPSSQAIPRGKKKGRASAATADSQPPVPPNDTRPQQLAPAPPNPNPNQQPPPQFPFAPLPPSGGNHAHPPGGFAGWSQHAMPHPHQQQGSQAPLHHQHPPSAPPQQVTHLAQVHHRPPPLLGHPFSAAGPSASSPTAAATLAAARGHWYGVSPAPPPAVDSTAQSSPRTHGRGSQQQQTQAQLHPPQSSFPPPPPHFDPAWAAAAATGPEGVYYPQHFATFGDSSQYVVGGPAEAPSTTQETTETTDEAEDEENGAANGDGENSRGRKRKRVPEGAAKKSKYVPPPPTNPSALVPALAPPRRSPTPPSRVVKSTYGGNLFTAEDISYLRAYIDWCVDMGLVLSLREICERLAVKAPHHTFYSWRRYCNKHKIKLGSYQMVPLDPSTSNLLEEEDDDHGDGGESDAGDAVIASSSGGGASATVDTMRRSPTPPKSLHRSTTGKGIAFTDEDVTFLVRYMTYRKHKEPNLNMPQFWNDLAAKAPHHSRASWLKYWRRHRHEIEVEADQDSSHPSGSSSLQVPTHQAPTTKRQRYSHEDDILLATFWATEPQGTSDKLFQDFAKAHPHHPWKGWQEHHRIHKTQVDHLIRLHLSGVDLHALPVPPPTKTGRPPMPKEGRE